jgi:hypothetical protein
MSWYCVLHCNALHHDLCHGCHGHSFSSMVIPFSNMMGIDAWTLHEVMLSFTILPHCMRVVSSVLCILFILLPLRMGNYLHLSMDATVIAMMNDRVPT